MTNRTSRADRGRIKRSSLWAVIVLLVVVGIPTTIGVFGGLAKTSGGEVAVVRNGGWFDNNQVRQVIQPGSGVTWIGFWSNMHRYPSQQRFYTITSRNNGGERTGVDVVNVPSSDGVSMGIEGTFYFALNLDENTLRQFDDKFGTRQFRGADGTMRNAWDGDEGWSSFLDQIIRPVIDNDLRQEVNNFRCAELVSSCALVQNQTAGGQVAPPVNVNGQANNSNIAKVQDAVNRSFAQDIKNTLGGEFLTSIHFNLSKVTLPDSVQKAVDDAQAAYAKVSEAQARVVQAQADADANKKRQEGYNACPACAQIDIMKAIPPNVTVYAPGTAATVPLTK
jgi:uncharacterized membrane protein YqiK